jgi:hypothetical protein
MGFEDDKREPSEDEPHLGEGGGVGEPHHQSGDPGGSDGGAGGDEGDEPHLGEGGGVGEPHHQGGEES